MVSKVSGGPRPSSPGRPAKSTAAESDSPLTASIDSELDGHAHGVKKKVTAGIDGVNASLKRDAAGGEAAMTAKGDLGGATLGVGFERADHFKDHKGSTGSVSKDDAEAQRAANAKDRAASVSVVRREGSVSSALLDTGAPDPHAKKSLRVQALQASAAGAVDVRVGLGTVRVDAKASAEVNAIRVDADAHFRRGGLTAVTHGEASIGAKIQANGSIRFEPRKGRVAAEGGFEAFAGARALVKGSSEVFTGVTLGGTVEADAGIGAVGKVVASANHGDFVFRGDIGATLGLGFRAGVNVELDAPKLARAAGRGVVNAEHHAVQVLHTAERNVRQTVSVSAAYVRHGVATFDHAAEVAMHVVRASAQDASRAAHAVRAFFNFW